MEWTLAVRPRKEEQMFGWEVGGGRACVREKKRAEKQKRAEKGRKEGLAAKGGLVAVAMTMRENQWDPRREGQSSTKLP